MTEPKLEWGPESEALFRNARRALSPPSAARDRVRARVALKVGTAAAAAAVGTATTKAAAGTGVSAATKGVTVALVLKIVAPVILVGAVTAAATRTRDTAKGAADKAPASASAGMPIKSGTSSVVTSNTAATAPASVSPPATAEAMATTSPRPSSTGSPKAPPKPAANEPVESKHGSPVAEVPPSVGARSESAPVEAARAESGAAPSAEETALVGEIDRALRAGDATRALRIAAEHEQSFPRGMLVEEREGARVIARCMTGSGASGASGFLAAHPRSPMRARVLAACTARTAR